ncbi:MAG: PAS domain S-box protein [Desulfomonile tiedjei]|uniref:histidine kinase n=1 Tax=Desulfomonile tiedjei TaxID=2358 RepID=A0A9D6V3U7_9BACT|nr:PAS domain S-box protein [Desulfomonile tiedjei]
MEDEDRQREEPAGELAELRRRVAELEAELTATKQLQDAEHESEALSKAMIQAFDGFVYVCSPNYEIEFMNERFIGRTGHNAIGEKCYEALHGLKDVCPWCVNEKVQKGETVRWEVQSPKDNRWYYVVNTPIHSQKDTISKVAMIQDITDRKNAEELLKKAKDELELRVRERTSELESSVRRLEKEISVREEAEAALRESEQRFRAIFENNHVVMLIIDPEDGRIEDGSPGALAFYGYSREQLKQKRISEINTLSPEEVFEKLQAAKSQQRRFFDFRHRLSSGEIRDVEVCTGPIVIGGKTFLFSVINDVTERKEAEESLARANQEWERTFNAFSDLVMVIDRHHKIVRANKSLTDAFGVKESDIIGRPCYDLIHKTQEPLPTCPHSSLLTNGEAHLAEVFDACLGGTFEVRVAPVMDQNGQLIGSVHIIRDITARKKMEEALGQSESTLKSVLQTAPVGIGLISNRIFKWSNEFLSLITGYSQEELLGQSTKILYENGEEFERIGAIKYALAGATGTGSVETRWKKKDGTLINIVESLTAIDPQNPSAGFVFTALDVTERKQAEQALRESEQRLTHVLSVSPAIIYSLNPDGFAPTWVSANIEILLGYTLEEALQSDWWSDHLYQEDRERAFINSARKRTEDQLISEYRFYRKNGDLMWVRDELRLLRDELGNPVEIVGVWTDITNRKQAEEAVQRSEERYRSLFEDAPLMYVITRNEQGVPFISDCNELFLRSVGYSREQVVGHPLEEFYSSESRAELLEHGGYARALAGDFFIGEREILTRDGRLIPTLLYTATEVAPSGQVIGTRAMFVDIAERKKMEDALRQSEERLELALKAADLGLWDWNLRTGHPIWDKRAIEMLGYSPDDIQHTLGGFKRLIHHEDWSTFSEALNGHLEGRLPSFQVECRFLCKSGDWRWILNQGKIVEYDEQGGPSRMTGTTRDVTERRVAEQEKEALRAQLLQSQKMEAIGTLAGGIAHDFNNLLTVVLGFSELLLVGKDERDPSYADLQRINQAGKNGADLVQRILAFSRKADINARTLNLNHEIEQLKKLLTRTIPKMIEIELNSSPELSMVRADPIQIEQVLMNLAVNAKDAMPDGGRLVIQTENVILDEEYCRSHFDAQPGNYVLLSVSDTGHGMDKETVERIFEPFYTTKETGKGTGLGLAMVYGIVKQHAGHVTCYSEPGVGTTFRIYLSAVSTESKSQLPQEKQKLLPGTETILLVDDEVSIIEFGKRILERSGYTVITANNGKTALEKYKKEKDHISLVILDLIMPEMGGKQCLEELLKLNKTARVLIASGYSMESQIKETAEAGGRGFVSKPYNVREMLQAVRDVLDSD